MWKVYWQDENGKRKITRFDKKYLAEEFCDMVDNTGGTVIKIAF